MTAKASEILFFKLGVAFKRVMLLFIISFLFLTAGTAQPENVTVKGNAKQYAGFNLSLRHYANYISYKSEELGNVKVDENGDFSLSFYIPEITYAYMDLGVFRGFIYLEPGKTYEIILPPYTPVREADRFNLYYRHEKIVIGIKNADASTLNKNINKFDNEYNFLFNKNAFRLFNKRDVKLTDEIVAGLDSMFPGFGNEFFDHYKQFRYAKLYMLSMKRQENRVISRFYSKASVEFENPAYWETFALLFKGFFTGYFSSKKGIALRTELADSTDFKRLSDALGADTLYAQREFREVVLLKVLYDAFYSGNYDKGKIIEVLNSAVRQGGTGRVRKIAGELFRKVNHLRVGTPAPEFSLYNINGKERSLSSYKGRFVYLNFCNTENHACKKDFQLLDAFSKRMRRDLTIVSIATDRDAAKLEGFVKSHKYKWDFLYFGDQANVIFDYDIRVLPTYILIDPDGNVLMSPAPAPEENFMARFYEAAKNYRYKKLRKERPKERSIYDF
jgi:peroxiredoxin